MRLDEDVRDVASGGELRCERQYRGDATARRLSREEPG
jgi:hypothetical protein